MASKRSQILERLRTLILPAIDGTGDYNFEAKTIERGWRHPVQLAGDVYPALFIATTSEKRKNDAIGTNRTFTSTLSVVVVGYVKNSKPNPKSDGTGVQLDLDKLIEDITHAIYADITQGGLCTYSDVSSIDTDDGDLTPVAGCAVSVTFGYYEEGNP